MGPLLDELLPPRLGRPRRREPRQQPVFEQADGDDAPAVGLQLEEARRLVEVADALEAQIARVERRLDAPDLPSDGRELRPRVRVDAIIPCAGRTSRGDGAAASRREGRRRGRGVDASDVVAAAASTEPRR